MNRFLNTLTQKLKSKTCWWIRALTIRGNPLYYGRAPVALSCAGGGLLKQSFSSSWAAFYRKKTACR